MRILTHAASTDAQGSGAPFARKTTALPRMAKEVMSRD